MGSDCDATNCPVDGGFLLYHPSVGGNAFMIVAFAILVPITIVTGYKFRTLGFAWTLTTGLSLEVLGFVGRLLLHGNRASRAYFCLSLLGTVLGPTCISAAIFITLPHVLSIYGERNSSLRPIHVWLFFGSLTLLSFAIELVGVVFLVFGAGGNQVTQSTHVLVAGLAVQAASLLLFIGSHVWFALGSNIGRNGGSTRHSSIYQSARFKRFLLLMEIATSLLLAYSIFRVVEIATGLQGDLSQNEIASMVVHGALPLLACIILTAFPPGAAFGKSWNQTSPRYRPARQRPSPLNSPSAPYDTTYRQHHDHYTPRYAIKRVGPSSHSPQFSPSNPYELYPNSPSRPSPTAPSHHSPLLNHQPQTPELPHGIKKSQQARGRLVDDDALW